MISQIMKEAGINLFPAEDSSKYVSIQNKSEIESNIDALLILLFQEYMINVINIFSIYISNEKKSLYPLIMISIIFT